MSLERFIEVQANDSEREERTVDHHFPLNHPTIEKAHLSLPPRSDIESSREGKDAVPGPGEGERDIC